MPFHAYGEGFDATECKEALKRSSDSPDRVLEIGKSLRKVGVVPGDCNPTYKIGMTTQVLGCRMNNNVNTAKM